MASISENRPSFQNLDPDSDHAKKIKSVLQTANWDYLCAKAVVLRQQGQPHVYGTRTCSVDARKFASGFYNMVVALTFSDSVQWVARIALPREGESADMYRSLMSEVATMNLIRTRTTIPVAEVFAYGFPTEDFGFAYILMEALPGKILDNRIALSVPDQHMRDFATQLANYVYELSTIQFSKIGRIMPSDSSEGVELSSSSIAGSGNRILSTSLEFFYHLRKEQTKAILEGHKNEQQWEAAAWFLEKTLTSMITEEHIYGPFPLSHLDLHYGNILVDENYRITGILDWSCAQTVPIERFAICPELIAPPAAPVEFKQAVFDFRDMFLEELEKIETERDRASPAIRM
ncbi:hypothetical protein N7474_009116 [Penicillium riverlandense]|uniref:uncharacterized protein n=1 Tax=Penicillium riverlandense TaxID=1903569 RepID=UPI002547E5AF|nr:uncharacterized protein N7474_009116 [Penicillium riverlandense]KAJ5807847.1 hypothetical protein N7474_009116 [Penicillium riverlandense]